MTENQDNEDNMEESETSEEELRESEASDVDASTLPTKDSFVPEIMLISEKGEKYLYKGVDVHTKNGMIKKDAIESAKPGEYVKSNIGHKLLISKVTFADMYRKIKRGAQIIPLKDLGLIAAETGVGKNSVVIDTGSGSGASACFFANICKKVYSFEVREDYYKIASHNARFLNLDNIEFKVHDVYESIPASGADLAMIDLPEPWKVVSHVAKALNSGGFFVSYSPCIPQVMDFVQEIERHSDDFVVIKTFEVMEKEWDVKERKVRPRSVSIGHSGFITICRRV